MITNELPEKKIIEKLEYKYWKNWRIEEIDNDMLGYSTGWIGWLEYEVSSDAFGVFMLCLGSYVVVLALALCLFRLAQEIIR